MSERTEALAEIVDIARVHRITMEEIAARLRQQTTPERQTHQSGLLASLFSYIGGLLIVGGMTVLIHMKWNELDYLGHILITFIPGMLALCIGVYCTFDERLSKAATPLFLLAASIEPTAVIITLRESGFLHGADRLTLFMSLIMAMQQGLILFARRRTVLAFTTSAFAFVFIGTALDMNHAAPRYVGIIVGTLLLGTAYLLSRNRFRTLAPVHYFFGSAFLLSGFASCVYGKPLELSFLVLCCLMIYASIIVRSRALLGTSAFAMLSFIGYYSARHFAHTIGWPITLIISGAMMIALGLAAIRISRRYITEAGR